MSEDSMHPARDLREKLLRRLLQVIAVLGAVAYVPSAYLSIREGIWIVLAADTLAFACAICLALLTRLPFAVRVGSLYFLSYVLGLVLLYFTGPFGAGNLFIFAFVFVVSLFGGLKSVLAANALAILTNAAFAAAAALHIIPWPQPVGSVVVVTANFIMVSLVLSFAANYLIRGYASAALAEKRLRESREEMLREVEHRVKNNLQLIASMVSLRGGPDVDARLALESIKGTVSAMSVVHRLLYRRSAFYLVDLKELLSSLVGHFGAIGPKVEISFQWSGPATEIDIDRAVTIGVLLNEIVMNSLKHAFPEGGRGTITVIVERDPQGAGLHLRVSDNGRGMPMEGVDFEGSGMSIIRACARQLGAEMQVSRAPGVTYLLTLTVETPAPVPA